MSTAAKAGRCIPSQNGIAAGLVFREDLEAVLQSQSAPAGDSAPARTTLRKETLQ